MMKSRGVFLVRNRTVVVHVVAPELANDDGGLLVVAVQA